VVVTRTWRSGDGPPQSGFTSPFSANGNFPSIHVGDGEGLRRVFVETGLFVNQFMVDPMASPFTPWAYAENGIFDLALAYTQGSGVPTDPVIPDTTEGGGGEYVWRALMVPRQDGFWTTPDGIAQSIRWEPVEGTQMQSESRRAYNDQDETWLTWVWSVIDVYGMFANDSVDLKSYMTGNLVCHALFESLV